MHTGLLEALRGTRKHLAEAADFLPHTSWSGKDEGLRELDQIIAAVETGEIDSLRIRVLFAPTGDMQEASLDGGWPDEFLSLSAQVDAALEQAEGD